MTNTTGDAIHDLIIENTPVDTRNLRTSWHREPAAPAIRSGQATTYKTTVSTSVSYAPYVEEGTGLWGPENRKYLIIPKKGNTLHWKDSAGHSHFAARVMHPGSPGAHMVAVSMAKVEHSNDAIVAGDLEQWKLEQEAKCLEAQVNFVTSKKIP